MPKVPFVVPHRASLPTARAKDWQQPSLSDKAERMSTPQPGIFAQGTRTHRHLQFAIRKGVAAAAIRAALNELRQPAVSAGGANIVLGFSAEVWRTISLDPVPTALTGFPKVADVPITQCGIWAWCHGTGEDVLLDVACAVTAALADVATLQQEVDGFVYRDSRDLTGFIDGTENPPVEAAYHVATIPNDSPGAGGSFAITQRWVHRLDEFNKLRVDEQEGVIGRTKADSIELPDNRKPANAHIARVVIEDGGEELEIYRRSVAYGTVAEQGLLFVAFSADPARFERMLRRMFGVDGCES